VGWSFVRREWGAVTFVLTVIIGMVAVPLALYFGNQTPHPVSAAPIATPASSAREASPSPTSTPTPVPSTPAPSST
jgi:hypothetical protein